MAAHITMRDIARNVTAMRTLVTKMAVNHTKAMNKVAMKTVATVTLLMRRRARSINAPLA